MLGLYAVLSHGVYEVSAQSLTSAQLRPVERDRFLLFMHVHKEAQMRTVQYICQEYRFALQDACRIALLETVAARLGRLLLELSHQIGEHTEGGSFRFPLLLTHEELASMTCTTRETVSQRGLDFDRGLAADRSPAGAAAITDLRHRDRLEFRFCRSRCRTNPSPTIIMGVGGFRSLLVSPGPQAVFQTDH
jgi:hypothetical protein